MKKIKLTMLVLLVLVTVTAVVTVGCAKKTETPAAAAGTEQASSEKSTEVVKGTKVVVGSKNYTEQYITAEMVSLLLEKAGYKVDRKFGMGSFAMRQGMLADQIDVSTDFTGTAWSAYLKQETNINDPVELYEAVKKMDKENGMVWTNRMTYNNTYALAVSKEYSEKYGLKTLEDLTAAVTAGTIDPVYAIEYEFFERPDGFVAMTEAYSLPVDKKKVVTMDIGLTYDAIKNGDVDISMVFSTDGNLVKYDLVVLEDTKAFFPIYNLCTVFTDSFYAENPGAEAVLAPLQDLLDQATITDLNYQVDGLGNEPEKIAKDFLTQKGLI